MAEMGSATVAAAGVTVLGVATGLDPAILVAGFVGGLWAQSYSDPAPYLHRIGMTLLAAVLAGYLAPAAATGLTYFDAVKATFTGLALQLPLAVAVGLTAHKVLGPAILRLFAKKAKELEE